MTPSIWARLRKHRSPCLVRRAGRRFSSHGDLHGERHDPATLTHLDLGGSNPEMGPFAFNRPEESVVVPFVNLFTKPTDLALEDAGAADCLPTQT